MATINNTDARQYNLVNRVGKVVVTVRLAPGLNKVDDEKWDAIKKNKYVKNLTKEGVIKELSKVKDNAASLNVADTKVTPTPSKASTPKKVSMPKAGDNVTPDK